MMAADTAGCQAELRSSTAANAGDKQMVRARTRSGTQPDTANDGECVGTGSHSSCPRTTCPLKKSLMLSFFEVADGMTDEIGTTRNLCKLNEGKSCHKERRASNKGAHCCSAGVYK